MQIFRDMIGNAMSRPKPLPFLNALAPYVGGRERIDGVDNPIKLSANENPLGASPHVRDALAEFSSYEIYPDGSATSLREALATLHNINPDHIVCANGSDEILHLLAQSYLTPDSSVVMTRHGFLVYRLVAEAAGAEVIQVPEPHLCADVDAILAHVRADTRIVFLANPNNPTGTLLSPSEIMRLHAGLRPDVMLVLDGAYAEYVPAELTFDQFGLVDQAPNVVVTRTFSKAYGLAALRVGWAYCPAEIADILNRVRGPFNVNSLALKAAQAALIDQEHITRSAAHNQHWRDWLTQQLKGLGIDVVPSFANFVLLRFASAEEAQRIDEALGRKGLIVRAMGGYGLPESLRVTVGTENANRRLVAALEEIVA